MTKYFSFDIIHEYGACIKIAIPDGVDNPQAVAQAYIEDLENKGLLGIETEYLETQVCFVEEVDEQDFNHLYILYLSMYNNKYKMYSYMERNYASLRRKRI